ncbi:CGNR zinc finger domain-containing protein [Streptomyces sp. NPDC051172]|uniref:CGNR zinc finger domain-containing protein n=1 Tax=Streptomyces sp. NPDC051172 TaxID=3155796 RepID=UPI0034270BAC
MSDLVPLTGEPLALDLVNTRPTAGDLLTTTDDLRAWWALQADRLPDEVPQAVTAADLAAVRVVREHTAGALSHLRRGDEPLAADLDALNRAQRAAPAINELAWNGSAVTATRRRDGSPGLRLAACLAEAAAELLSDPAVTRIRECEADDCVMLFLAAHPRRRWCSATRCGNRVRVARHYQRNKAG